jgi:hypothetical protein
VPNVPGPDADEKYQQAAKFYRDILEKHLRDVLCGEWRVKLDIHTIIGVTGPPLFEWGRFGVKFERDTLIESHKLFRRKAANRARTGRPRVRR